MQMPRIKYIESDVTLLARIMRAEALGEGEVGMQLVGNVVVNRVIANCSTFKKMNTISKVVYQPGQFAGVDTPLFKAYPTKKEQRLAKECLDYFTKWPATRSLYFKNPGKNKPCPSQFWGPFVGKYKQHCFYRAKDSLKCNI